MVVTGSFSEASWGVFMNFQKVFRKAIDSTMQLENNFNAAARGFRKSGKIIKNFAGGKIGQAMLATYI
jgi:hypothetical protein